MSSSILNIGVQALNANQTALSYVGQNIANVNTDGYSRLKPSRWGRRTLQYWV